MNQAQIDPILLERNAYLRQELWAFTEQCFRSLEPGKEYLDSWHVGYVCELLMAQLSGEIQDLVINIPPRCLKSTAATIAFPAFILGHDPSKQVMAASFSNALSMRHNQDCRRIIESEWYKQLFPATLLRDDQNTKTFFQTTMNGHRIATSVGSTIIGQGGDHLIVDDPIGATQAESETVREEANDWFDKGFSPRRNNPRTSTRTVVMQRLHQKDLTGYIRSKLDNMESDDQWYIAEVPLIAEKKTIVQFGRFAHVREQGEVLQPERFSPKVINNLKEELGSYVFSGQYQQRPVPVGGGMFKESWFPRYKEVPLANRIVQSWDTAGKGEATSAYSVCHTFAECDDGYYLLHVLRARLAYPELKRTIESMAIAHKADVVLIEDKSSGEAVIQDLRASTKLPILAINPVGDKEARAAAVSALCEAGKVLLPERAPWLPDWQMEIQNFPKSDFRDQVDSFSQALRWMKESRNAIDRYRIRIL